MGAVFVAPTDDQCRAEIGIALVRAHWGEGLAVAAALRRAAAAALCDLEGVERAEALVDADDAASRRALEDAGFCLEAVLRSSRIVEGRLRDTAVYSVISTDPVLVSPPDSFGFAHRYRRLPAWRSVRRRGTPMLSQSPSSARGRGSSAHARGFRSTASLGDQFEWGERLPGGGALGLIRELGHLCHEQQLQRSPSSSTSHTPLFHPSSSLFSTDRINLRVNSILVLF